MKLEVLLAGVPAASVWHVLQSAVVGMWFAGLAKAFCETYPPLWQVVHVPAATAVFPDVVVWNATPRKVGKGWITGSEWQLVQVEPDGKGICTDRLIETTPGY